MTDPARVAPELARTNQVFRRSGGRDGREAVLEELWFWFEAVVGWLPGRTGRLLRAWAYRPIVGSDGALDVAEHTHIRMPWRLQCGRQVSIGRGSQLTCTGGLSIGDDVLIGPGVTIVSNNHVFADPARHIRDQGLESAPVTIHDDVWIGAHVVVLPGVTIGEGAVVAAGAVVRDDVAAFAVVAGVPARPVASRGAEPAAGSG